MKLIQGLSDQPKQQISIVLDGGTVAVWSLTYRALQKGWFYDLSWNGSPLCKGQRLVASPNFLRQFINKIPFGISLVTQGDVEPTSISDLSNGVSVLYLLQGDDLSLVETAAYGAPEGQIQPTAETTGGIPAIIPPSSWGPAGGDLRGSYPNPQVGALHTADGLQLLYNLIADNTYLKRSGFQIVGSVPPGGGDVVGPASAGNGRFALFDGTSGKLLKNGPSLTDGTYDASINSLTAASAIVSSIIEATRFTFPLVTGYPGSGTCNLNLTAQNNIFIDITGALAVVDAARAPGMMNIITVRNISGSTRAVTWPAWLVANGYSLPTSIPNGRAITFWLQSGGTIGDSTVFYSEAASSGVTSLTLAGRGLSGSSNPIIGAGTLTGYDANTYNVCDFGADPTGTADSYAAIAAAISALVGSGKPGTLYLPDGRYKSSHALPVVLGSGQAFAWKGNAVGSGQLIFTDTGSDAGIVITKTASAGSASTDCPVTVSDMTLVCNSNGVANALKLTMSGTDAASVGNRIERVAFSSTANDLVHNWAVGVYLNNVSNVDVSHCSFIRTNIGSLVDGSNGVTSGFWYTNNLFQGGSYGLKVSGLGGPSNRIEGVKCHANEFINQVNYNVWFENSNAGGVLDITGGSMTVVGGAGACVHAVGVNGVMIRGVSMSNPGGAAAWNGVELHGACQGSCVTGNYMVGDNTGGTVQGVSVQGSNYVAVYGNSFVGMSTNVIFDASTTRSNCSNNVSSAGAYTDNGSGNSFNNNI